MSTFIVLLHKDLKFARLEDMDLSSNSNQNQSNQSQYQPTTYNFNAVGDVVTRPETRRIHTSLSGLIKLLLILLVPIGVLAGVFVYISSNGQESTYRESKGVMLSVPMKQVNWQDLGNVFEPVIELPIKTEAGYENWEFLLDSGAVVSSLPREWAEKTGQDLAKLKRSTFRGFGGKTSFAYQGEMMVLLGEEDRAVPVVFTEANGTKSLLGRKGFFEDYSVYFNHKEQQIEIRE